MDVLNKFIHRPIMRQLLLILGVTLNIVSEVTAVGFTAILIPELRQPNTGFEINTALEAWIGSSLQLGMIIGGLLCFVCSDSIGRKKSHLLTIVPTVLGWAVITFATNTLTIIYARCIQGLASGLRVPLTSIIIGECTTPRYRGGFLATATSSLSFGIFLAHLIGTLSSSRIIAIASTVISLLSLVIILIVPDSPTWLAKVGRTEEAYKAFRWFRGDGAKATMEFEKILINLKKDNETPAFNCDLLKSIFSKQFYKPFLLMTAVSVAYHGSGITVMAHFTMDIISKVFDSDAANSYVMLAVDVLRIVCSLLGCIIMKKFNRRTVFHVSASFVMVALLTMSLYVYLQNTYDVKRDEVLVAAIFLYIYGAGTGVQAMTYVLLGEVFPVNLRALGGGMVLFILSIYAFGVLLFAPFMFQSIGREGTFLTYAGFLALSWLYIYFFMPETKNKTLVDIELKLKEYENAEELQSLNVCPQIVNNG